MNARRLSLFWLFLLVLAAFAGPLALSERAQTMDFARALIGPSHAHWLGTDGLGRDLFCRLIVGAQVSVMVGFFSVLLAVLIGLAIGAAAGYYGGWIDRLLSGMTDIMLCFPSFFLILAVIAVLGSSVLNILVVIGVTSWMGTARLVRAQVLTLKEREYILAVRALGGSDLRILARHLIPNALGPVVVNAILSVSGAILTEAGLSFLGIGVQPPVPSWGNILMEGKATLGVAWWLTLFPGLMIFLTVLASNTLGESFQS